MPRQIQNTRNRIDPILCYRKMNATCGVKISTMRRSFIRGIIQSIQPYVVFMALLTLIPVTSSLASTWKTLSPGMEYQDLIKNPLTPWAHIHVFRIDLQHYQLDLVTAKDLSKRQASINELARKSHAMLAINGGFFDSAYRPLGLRIYQQQEHNPVKHISWWGIFLIKNQIPSIISSREYETNHQVQFAIQSGPRLIINGSIPHLRPGVAERSALGLTRRNKLIVLVTDNALITTTELAQLMKSTPLNCENALNLDGGSSSQLYARIASFRLNVHGFSNVSDAIVITPKKH